MLVSEPAEKRSAALPPNVGTFQLMPGEAMTKFSHKCSNAIEATSSISKEQVQVSLQSKNVAIVLVDVVIVIRLVP